MPTLWIVLLPFFSNVPISAFTSDMSVPANSSGLLTAELHEKTAEEIKPVPAV